MTPDAVGRGEREVPEVEAPLIAWTERARDVVFYARAHCKAQGYALAVHGSLRRDIDVVAVPWTEEAVSADELAQSLFGFLKDTMQMVLGWGSGRGVAERKPHGRLGYDMVLAGDPFCYLDLSVMPAGPALPPDAGGEDGDEEEQITDAILCRVFDGDDYDRLREAWRAYDRTGWFHWSRAFGAFLATALAAARRSATERKGGGN